jgi:hypothetical protein
MSIEGMSDADRDALAELAAQVWNHPDTRLEAMRLAKKANPQRQYPELDIAEREAKLRDEFEKKLDTERSKREESELRRQRDVMISDAIASGKVTDRAEFEKIEKHGIEAGISKFETAVVHYRASQQQATPSEGAVPDFGPPQMPQLEGLKDKFGGNVHRWAEAEAHKVLGELRTGNIKLPPLQTAQ